MSAIIDALKNQEENLRIDNGSRWLVWSDDNTWTVYERTYGAKKTKRIISTTDEAQAVAALLGQGKE